MSTPNCSDCKYSFQDNRVLRCKRFLVCETMRIYYDHEYEACSTQNYLGNCTLYQKIYTTDGSKRLPKSGDESSCSAPISNANSKNEKVDLSDYYKHWGSGDPKDDPDWGEGRL